MPKLSRRRSRRNSRKVTRKNTLRRKSLKRRSLKRRNTRKNYRGKSKRSLRNRKLKGGEVKPHTSGRNSLKQQRSQRLIKSPHIASYKATLNGNKINYTERTVTDYAGSPAAVAGVATAAAEVAKDLKVGYDDLIHHLDVLRDNTTPWQKDLGNLQATEFINPLSNQNQSKRLGEVISLSSVKSGLSKVRNLLINFNALAGNNPSALSMAEDVKQKWINLFKSSNIGKDKWDDNGFSDPKKMDEIKFYPNGVNGSYKTSVLEILAKPHGEDMLRVHYLATPRRGYAPRTLSSHPIPY